MTDRQTNKETEIKSQHGITNTQQTQLSGVDMSPFYNNSCE